MAVEERDKRDTRTSTVPSFFGIDGGANEAISKQSAEAIVAIVITTSALNARSALRV